MQTEAVYSEPTHETVAVSRRTQQGDEGPGELVTFVRAGRPPLRVRAFPGPSVERTISGERCRIALWERAKGGVVIELLRPSPRGLEAEVIVSDTISKAAFALEKASLIGLSDAPPISIGCHVDTIISSSLQAVRYRAASRAFRAMISDFLSLLGPEAEVVLPGTYRDGDGH